jgi:PPE-repeat protein
MNLSRHVFGACTLTVAALFNGLGSAACAADRGLSVSIGADRASARSIHASLGFGGPLRELAGAGLSPAGQRAAFARLLRDTQPGDRVFVYVASPARAAPGGRAAGLSALAQALGRQAAQVVMVIDAPGAAQLTALPADGRVVVLAAARHAARADPRRGSLATRALRGCLARPGFTANPLASFGDLADCAQRTEPAAEGPLLVIAGNDELPLQPRLTALVDPSANPSGESALDALQRVAAGADAQWHVGVADAADGVGNAPAWAVTSDRDGFLYIVRAAADGSSLNLVYPQRPGEPNLLHAGQGFELPRSGLAVPLASDRLMVLVSDLALRSGDLLVKLGLAHYAAAACLRNLGSDDCPSTAAGPAAAPVPLRFGAALLP